MATTASQAAPISHPWWWNSHISPKSSKWLQESLTDMDSKISAMLKIIEEDADSFAQRAEMYYKRRPELVNLVEEFYRAYRALAERYHSLTGELRQSFRARYAHSDIGSSPKSHNGLHHKKDVHAFDPLEDSLSQSFERGFDYDEDLNSEISSKKLKMPFDDGGPFSAYMEVENEDDNSKLISKLLYERKKTDSLPKINTLQQEIHQLVEENRQLRLETAAQRGFREKHELQLSELQEQIKNLEAECNKIREKLRDAINQEHVLEDENPRLKQLHLSMKEETNEVAMLHEQRREDYKLARKKIKDLEEQLYSLRQLATEEASSRAYEIMRLEEEGRKLQTALLAAQHENKKKEMELQCCIQKILDVEKEIENLQDRINNLQTEKSNLKDELALKISLMEKHQQQLLEWQNLRTDLEGEIHAKEEAETELKENLRLATEQVKRLKAEIQHLEQSLHDLQLIEHKFRELEEEFLQLQEENKALESVRHDGAMCATDLKEELQHEQERKILHSATSLSIQKFRKQQEDISILEIQKKTSDDGLSISTTQFKEAEEELLKLQDTKCLPEMRLSMQLSMVAQLEEDGYKLPAYNNELANRLESRTKQFEELQENMLKLQQVLTNQQEESRELIDKPSMITHSYNALLEAFKKLSVNLSQLKEENHQIRMEASVMVTDVENLRREIAQLNQEKYGLHPEPAVKLQQTALLEEESTNQKKEEELEKELQDSYGKIQILEEKLLVLEHMVTKLQEENSTLVEITFRSEENYKDLQKKLNRANEETQPLRNENEQRKMDMVNQIELVEKLEKEKNKFNEEKNALEDETYNTKMMEKLHEDARKLQEKEKRPNSAAQNKLEELQQQDEEIHLFCRTVSHVEQENESLRILLSKSRDESISLGNIVTERVDEFTCLKTVKNQTLEQIERHKELTEEDCRLQIGKDALFEEASSTAKQVDISYQELIDFQEHVKVLEDSFQAREEIKTLQLKIQELGHTLTLTSEDHNVREKEWKDRIHELCDINTTLKAELASARAQMGQLEEEKFISQKENRTVNDLLISRDVDIKLLQEELLFLREQIIGARSFNSVNQTAHEQTTRVADEMGRMIEDYEQKINQLNNQILELQDQNSRLEAEASDKVGKLESFYSNKDIINANGLHQELQQLHEEKEFLCAQLENKLDEVQNMEMEMKKLQQTHLSMQQEIKSLQMTYIMHQEKGKGYNDDDHHVESTSFSTENNAAADYIIHHVNLGNRLNQEIVDDKMQLQLQKLRDVHRKLKLRLQGWAEHLEKLRDELEKTKYLVARSSDENGYDKGGIKDLQRDTMKHNKASNSLRVLEERMLQLQKKKDELGQELKFNAKETKRIKKQLLNLFELENRSSFEEWKAQACKMQDHIDELQEKNEKHLDVFQEMDEHVEKIQLELQTLCHQSELIKEENLSSLHDFKPFSIKHYSEQALSWLSIDRSRKVSGGIPKKVEGILKEPSTSKKCCRCCICMDPKSVTE